MRIFGVLFNILGVALGAVSAVAISDPNSIHGWDDWLDDPWAAGLMFAAVLIFTGTSLLVARRFLTPEAEAAISRGLWIFSAGVCAFVLLMPYEGTLMCVDGADGGFCREQDWSTITGLTFSGKSSYALALGAAAGVALVMWWALRRGTNKGRTGAR